MLKVRTKKDGFNFLKDLSLAAIFIRLAPGYLYFSHLLFLQSDIISFIITRYITVKVDLKFCSRSLYSQHFLKNIGKISC